MRSYFFSTINVIALSSSINSLILKSVNFRKSEISSFVDDDLDAEIDSINGFGDNSKSKREELDSESKSFGEEESPLEDLDDDIEIPAFIRKKMGK